MKYNWKKALASAGSVFVGVIVASIGVGSDVPTTWAFWKHTLITAGTTTLAAEARYIYSWLGTIGNGNGTPPPPVQIKQ